MGKVLFAVRKDGQGGYVGEVWITADGLPAPLVRATATGATKPEVAMQAANIAEKALNNPVVQALMPPQAAIALKAMKLVGADAAAGKLAKSAARFAGPAAKRLGKVLGGLF